MQLIGASCSEPESIASALEAASVRGFPCFVCSNGTDIVAVLGEAGDGVDDVIAFALRVLVPEGQ